MEVRRIYEEQWSTKCRALDHTLIDTTGGGGIGIKSSDMGALVKEVMKPSMKLRMLYKDAY